MNCVPIISLVLCLIGVAVAGSWNKGKHSSRSWSTDVPECKELKNSEDGGYGLDNCSDQVLECFKNAHTSATRCVKMSKNDWSNGGNMQCYIQKMNYLSDWFKYSCKWHLGTKKCMTGETVPAEYQPGNEAVSVPEVTDDDENEERKACFEETKAQLEACSEMAASDPDCSNYQYCSGEVQPTGDERLVNWYNSIVYLKQQRDQKQAIMKQQFKECAATN